MHKITFLGGCDSPTKCCIKASDGDQYCGYILIDKINPSMVSVYHDIGGKDNEGKYGWPENIIVIMFSPATIIPYE